MMFTKDNIAALGNHARRGCLEEPIAQAQPERMCVSTIATISATAGRH